MIVDRRQRGRYLLSIYLVVLFGSLILIAIGLQLDPKVYGDIRNIILSISTELIAVVLIFIIINKIFLVDQWNADEKIAKLIESFERNRKTNAIDFFKTNIDLLKFYTESKSIELSGVTLNSEIVKNFSLFREHILNGYDMKFMLVDPNSIAIKMSSLRSEDEGNDSYYLKKLDVVFGSFDFLKRSIENAVKANQKLGKFEVRLLPYAPSYAIHRITKKDNKKYIIVELYPHKIGNNGSPMFILDSEKDKEWYNYFSSQYDVMWEHAKVWDFEVEKFESTNV